MYSIFDEIFYGEMNPASASLSPAERMQAFQQECGDILNRISPTDRSHLIAYISACYLDIAFLEKSRYFEGMRFGLDLITALHNF